MIGPGAIVIAPPACGQRTLRWGLLFFTAIAVGCAGLRHQSPDPWKALARRDAMPLARLPQLVRKSRIVVVGEAHALVEPIDTVRMLLSDRESGAFTHVALEWPVSDQPDIDRFMSGDDTVMERFRRKYGQLPGATDEYWGIFSCVRQSNRRYPGQAVKICAVDVPHPVRDTAEEERDRHMFSGIEQTIQANPKHRVLVHAGANHTAKSGWVEVNTREGDAVPMPILGARLRERYAKGVVSIKILSPDDPLWKILKQEGAFKDPVVIPLTSQWPDPQSLFSFWRWHSGQPNGAARADAAYDYVVWWPTSRDGKRSR